MPDNSPQICAEVLAATERYVAGETPEGRAYLDRSEAAYTGRDPDAAGEIGQLRRRYFDAWAGEIRPLVEQAHDEQLRNVLRAYTDVLGEQAAEGPSDGKAMKLVTVQKKVNEECTPG